MRIGCCIPGCRRTYPKQADVDDYQVMCGRHWRTIDLPLRERHKQMKKRSRRIDRLLMRKTILARRQVRGVDKLERIFLTAMARAWSGCVIDATIKAAFDVEPTRRKQSAAPPRRRTADNPVEQ
jgi:hypothetical protein